MLFTGIGLSGLETPLWTAEPGQDGRVVHYRVFY